MIIVQTKRIGVLLLIFSFCSLNYLQAQTVMEELKSNQQTSMFAEALVNADLDERFNQTGSFTVFVPSNDAFSQLPGWQTTENSLLLNHVFTGMATARRLRLMSNVTCLSGQTVSINQRNGNLFVNSFEVLQSNIQASNGVIHIIDGVIK